MYGQIPYMVPQSIASTGTSFLSKISLSSLLTNAQKTLSVVNQAIPLYYQVKPMFNNLKTIRKIGKELMSTTSNNNDKNSTNVINNQLNETINPPILNEESIPLPMFFK